MWGCRYLFKMVILSPLNIYPEVELLNHMVILVLLIFWGTFILFAIMAIQIYISTNSTHGFSFFLHPHQHFKTWEVISFVILIWIFLMLSDTEHLFMYLLAISVSFEKCLFRLLVCFSFFFYVSFFFSFLLLSCMSSLYILDFNSISDIWFSSILSHSIGYYFILLTISFAVQKLFSLM